MKGYTVVYRGVAGCPPVAEAPDVVPALREVAAARAGRARRRPDPVLGRLPVRVPHRGARVVENPDLAAEDKAPIGQGNAKALLRLGRANTSISCIRVSG